MTGRTADNEEDMKIFSQAVGELVLWASAIDAQLTKAVILAFSLKESSWLESFIAEVDARAKIESLKKWSNLIQKKDWSTRITKWTEKIEKVNSYRNIVAHHQVGMSAGKLILHSDQARKLLKKIKKNSRHTPNKTVVDTHMTVNDIQKWVKEAAEVYVEGQKVVDNLARLAQKLAAKEKNR